jgi:S-adenosylmethionine-diacylglycerol 3-amino-3-carboxypropyl transferase
MAPAGTRPANGDFQVNVAAKVFEPTSADLLSEAVHQNRALSPAGLLERTFTFAFRSMVYPQIWEDPRADMEALELTSQSRMVTIASGGCNVMSYLAGNPARIYAIDLNETHIALLKLKLSAAQHLPNHTTFYRFFGSADDLRNVHLYRDLVAPHLDATTRAYWEGRDVTGRRRISRFARNFYRYGLLGRFITAGHIAARVLGANPKRILDARNIEEQREIFAREVAPAFDHPLLRWITSSRVSLFGLGIPPVQYDALSGQRPMSEVLKERAERLATGFDLKDNYFAWQAFGRRYAAQGQGPCPLYLEKANYMAVKTRTNRVTVVHDNMIRFLSNEPTESLDRYVLLDAQDWMDDTALNDLWREITRTARPGARVIFRTAGEESILSGRVSSAILEQWTYDAARSAEIHAKDRSAIYGGFHLYVKAD